MRSFFVRAFALFLGTASIVTFAGPPAANAVAPDTHAASFVGNYTIFFTIGGSGHLNQGLLTVNANGTADDHLGDISTWSNKGKAFTMRFADSHVKQIFLAKQTAKGLSNRKHPGTYTNNGDPGGTWWGVKQPG